jgi:hypothetical protein
MRGPHLPLQELLVESSARIEGLASEFELRAFWDFPRERVYHREHRAQRWQGMARQSKAGSVDFLCVPLCFSVSSVVKILT